ncbi:MAG: hypothetical protein ABSF27_09900 [Candidatus Dormibacteria bacterium]
MGPLGYETDLVAALKRPHGDQPAHRLQLRQRYGSGLKGGLRERLPYG